MCGRYTLRRPGLLRKLIYQEGFEEFSQIRITPKFEAFEGRPRFNIAPSQPVPVVRINKEGLRALDLVQWGLIPHWAKALPKVRPINARAETVTSSGVFRQAFARRRCIVPADGFYEWRKVDAKTKQPMWVHFPDDRMFGFAGLWERWKPAEDAEPLDTCTIITTTPNALMAPIHNRMPVILHPQDYSTWLDKETDPAAAQALLRPYPEGEMEAVPVDKLVNSPKNDVPECVKPLAGGPDTLDLGFD